MLHDVQFTQTIRLCIFVNERPKFVCMPAIHITNDVQPVIDKAMLLQFHCRLDAAATIVPAMRT